ncbi:hypothetical protein Daus18300_010065 [Diaporthe australafricana]|uniref:Uncharacterized protein n=1 Tax=Diaporthe australafricana TaxID=127596 RepID=A0ABR3WBR8_9PEZI
MSQPPPSPPPPPPTPDDAYLRNELQTLQDGFTAFQATIRQQCDCAARAPAPPAAGDDDAQCACDPCNCPTADQPCNSSGAPAAAAASQGDLSDEGLRRVLNQLTGEVRGFMAEQDTMTCGCAARAATGGG